MTDESDPTGGEQRPPHLFKPGQSGNPKGRPKGSRNKLGEQFLNDLQADWADHGANVLAAAREESPVQYAKMVASILPKELLVRRAPEEDMTDDELADAIDALDTLASRLRDGREGPSPTHSGSGTA